MGKIEELINDAFPDFKKKYICVPLCQNTNIISACWQK